MLVTRPLNNMHFESHNQHGVTFLCYAHGFLIETSGSADPGGGSVGAPNRSGGNRGEYIHLQG